MGKYKDPSDQRSTARREAIPPPSPASVSSAAGSQDSKPAKPIETSSRESPPPAPVREPRRRPSASLHDARGGAAGPVRGVPHQSSGASSSSTTDGAGGNGAWRFISPSVMVNRAACLTEPGDREKQTVALVREGRPSPRALAVVSKSAGPYSGAAEGALEPFLMDLRSLRERLREEHLACDLVMSLDLTGRGGLAIGLLHGHGSTLPYLEVHFATVVNLTDDEMTTPLEELEGRLAALLQAVDPDRIFYRKVPPRHEPSWFDVPFGFDDDNFVTECLEVTLKGWAAQYHVPCQTFTLAALKRRFTGRAKAGARDLVRACNESINTKFNIQCCQKTHVDQAAIAALGMIEGLLQLE